MTAKHTRTEDLSKPYQSLWQWAMFQMFWLSLFAIRGIMCCGIEALCNLAPHLKQLHMFAL